MSSQETMVPPQAQVASARDVFVGRQPIYDRDRRLVAYELLFRGGSQSTSAQIIDGDQATFTVMLNALVEIGLSRLVGDAKAFINLTRNSVLCEYAQFFPKDRVVLEVLEDVTVDQELLEMVYKFSGKGYEIALDDFVYRDELQPLLKVAGMVKIDVQALDEAEVRAYVEQFGDLKLLAEKVETEEEYEFCRRLGFDYFQGYFLAKPKTITVKHVPTSQLANLRLLTRIHDEDCTLDDLAKIIRQDISLSYRLLRSVDPSRFDEPVHLSSVADAVKLLGHEQLSHWTMLLSISGEDDSPPELMVQAMRRARFCELAIDRTHPKLTDQAYVCGLLSLTPNLVGVPIEELLHDLALDPQVTQALLHQAGPLSAAVKAAESLEDGAQPLGLDKLSAEELSALWSTADRWTTSARRELGI